MERQVEGLKERQEETGDTGEEMEQTGGETAPPAVDERE